MAKISVLINTLNEEKRIARALASVSGFANEIVVIDMHSTDKTVEIAKNAGARVYSHKKIGYVEPVRNFGIEKCKHDWVFILDADERLPKSLKDYLKTEIKKPSANYYRIPRKNLIFGKWIKHTGWWPDYNIRFFKKDTVSWNEIIHSVPTTSGLGVDLPAERDFAIIHNSYSSLEEYILRMNRYTTIQAKLLNKGGVKFYWTNLITKPSSQFLTRFFAQEGYKDGLHGLALSLLQAFAELVLYLKLWQKGKFERKKISTSQLKDEIKSESRKFIWWYFEVKIGQANIFRKAWLKLQRKLKLQ